MVGACMYVDEYTCVDVWNFRTCGVLMMIMNVCCVCAWASSRLRLAIVHVHIVHFVHNGLRLPWRGDSQMDQAADNYRKNSTVPIVPTNMTCCINDKGNGHVE